MTLFGITIPLWAIVAALVLLFVFRNEVREVFRNLFERFFPSKPKLPNQDVQNIVLQSLAAHGVSLGEGQFNGQRLVAVLKAFRDFMSVIANVTPNRVDDVAVRFIVMLTDVLERNQDIADMIARFVNLLVYRGNNNNQ